MRHAPLPTLAGASPANALMTEFPSYEPDELVTKGYLRAELAELEMRLTIRMGVGFAGMTAILAALKVLG